ncbi:MAG: trypsin-like serine protease [Proteobacteria bacterium]|nr:trypsin-like serine protease [Pseudomonadota bacterium]
MIIFNKIKNNFTPPHSLSFFCHIIIIVGLLLTTACKAPPNDDSNLASLSTRGGTEYRKFEDLPGYFVSLNKGDSFCSGAHIGDGYILTAAHCLEIDLCQDDDDLYSRFKHFGLHYNSRVDGKQKETRLTRSQIEAVVMHKHYFIDPDSILIPADFLPSDSDSDYDSLESWIWIWGRPHDIALIKVNVNPSAPFAGKTTLPNADFRSSMQRFEDLTDPEKKKKDTLYLHGIGREYSEAYKKANDWLLKYLLEKKGVAFVSKSYFGGALQVMPGFGQWKSIDDARESYEGKIYSTLHSKLNELRNDPDRLKTVDNLITESKGKLNQCYQDLFQKNKQTTSVSHFTFSEDGLTAQNLLFTQPRNLLNEFTQLTEVSDEKLEQYASEMAKKLSYHQRVVFDSSGYGEFYKKWLLVSQPTLGEPLPDSISGSCGGDSGGPVVKHIDDNNNIHVATHVAGTRDTNSNCGPTDFQVKTFPHLNWIKAAKASMTAGNHSYRRKYQTLHFEDIMRECNTENIEGCLERIKAACTDGNKPACGVLRKMQSRQNTSKEQQKTDQDNELPK